jgi:DNA-binding NarL/FixJ family response regulator
MATTVLLADDHPLVREGLRSLIEDLPDYTVVGDAADGDEAIDRAGALQPDVMLLDITMPRLSGIDALPRIALASPGTRVLIVAMYDTADFVMKALQAGAAGYLLKDAASRELPMALDAVREGRSFLSPAVSTTVIRQALGAPVAPQPPPAADPRELPLTPRQIQILRLVASGRSMKAIAYELGLSVKTVETHRAQIMKRLDVHDVPRLVLLAARYGLAPSDV